MNKMNVSSSAILTLSLNSSAPEQRRFAPDSDSEFSLEWK